MYDKHVKSTQCIPKNDPLGFHHAINHSRSIFKLSVVVVVVVNSDSRIVMVALTTIGWMLFIIKDMIPLIDIPMNEKDYLDI